MEYAAPEITQKNFAYEDDDVIVVNKPAGIATHPLLREEQNTLIQQIVLLRPEIQAVDPASLRPGVVHRLDRNTSGLIVIAKNKNAHLHLIKQFSERKAEKHYTALVRGPMFEDQGTIETLIGRDPGNKKRQKTYSSIDPAARRRNLKPALTAWRVLKNFQEWSLIEASPKTGRRHQIRVHLASIGHPLAGDNLYGFKDTPIPGGLTRHFLHASYLKFTGADGKIYKFESPLPEELDRVLRTLK